MRQHFAPVICASLAAMLLVSPAATAQRNILAAPPSSHTEHRVALVIGNASYQRAPLRNPINDARAIAQRLRQLGFVVVVREDLKTREIGATLREFRNALQPGGVGLFFYAGHGLQVKGINYLPTVDSQIDAEEDVYTQSLDVAKILEVMEESKTRINLVFMDACRDNPYARRFRSASRGLARMDAASGTLISFATRPGSVASDGEGENGLFTEHLLNEMNEVGVPIEQVLKRVGAAVKAASRGRQEPWSEGLIEGDFYFRPGTALAAAASTATIASAERTAIAYVNGKPVWDLVYEALLTSLSAKFDIRAANTRERARLELLNREIIAQAAAANGGDVYPDPFAVRDAADARAFLVQQEGIVSRFINNFRRDHPISEAEMKAEYDRARDSAGSKEFRVRHIQVENEQLAREIIARLEEGASFESLAREHTKDAGTRARGGDLEWNPGTAFEPEFGNAVLKLDRGTFTRSPVRTRFGYHVIWLDDMRPVQFPDFAAVKPKIEQHLMQTKIETMIKELRAAARIE